MRDLLLEAKTNQQGQALGRKGLETRRRLMDAARRLLEIHSPVEITAVAIAKQAGTSSASFYMYFEDVRDVLYALGVAASADMAVVHQVVEEPWDVEPLQDHALRMVEKFQALWDQHRQVLRFRNQEADRGDPRFEALRLSTYVPFIDMLARRIVAATPADRPKPSLSQAFALASVLHAAMERLMSTDPAVVARGVGFKKLHDALAHVVMLVFDNASLDAPSSRTPAAAPAKRRPRVAAKAPIAPAVPPRVAKRRAPVKSA